jgi:colanic acid/amylovoran biosynthesis protein
VFDGQAPDAGRYYPDIDFRLPALGAVMRYPRIKYVGRIVRELNTRRWLAAASVYRRAPQISRLLLRPGEFRKLGEYAATDVAITTGGTYLVERYSPWPRLFEFRLVLRLGVPLIFYTQSIGAFEKPTYRKGLREVLDAASLVLLRDERSQRHVEDLGASPERMEVVADVALALAQAPDEAAYRLPEGGPRRVAISVREWQFFTKAGGREAYEAGLIALVTDLVRERGADVTFISTCQGVPEYWTDDSAYALGVAAELPEDVRERITVDRSFRTPTALMEELSRFDMAVCTRFHMAILALNAGTPVLPISYEFKTREFFEGLGLGAYVTDIDDVDDAGLLESLRRFADEADAWRPALLAGLAQARQRVDRSRELLGAAVAGC